MKEFDRKTSLQQASLVVESLVPRAAPVGLAAAAAGTAAFAGVFEYIPHEMRPYALGLAVLAALAPQPFIKAANPFKISRSDARHKLDEISGDPNKPATMIADNIHENVSSRTKQWWENSQLQLLSEKLPLLKPSRPHSGLSAPIKAAALSAAMALGVSGLIAGDERMNRLQEAFNFTAPIIPEPPPQIVAWITPPDTIQKAPSFTISDGKTAPSATATLEDIHPQSVLNMSVYGGNPVITLNGEPLVPAQEMQNEAGEPTYRYTITLTGDDYAIAIENGPVWNLQLREDNPPSFEITGMDKGAGPNLTARCKAQDDYGIQTGQMVLSVPGARAGAEPPNQTLLPQIDLSGPEMCQ